ncbi:MAG: hypothetical protein ABFC78_10855 [Methanoregula sp.]|jgi:hypothetical protein
MKKYPGIPELLETYMVENATDERWITVQELRTRFSLTRYQGATVSAFLRRLEQGPFVQFPYIVLKIERIPSSPSENVRGYRYLVSLRQCSSAHKRRIVSPATQEPWIKSCPFDTKHAIYDGMPGYSDNLRAGRFA